MSGCKHGRPLGRLCLRCFGLDQPGLSALETEHDVMRARLAALEAFARKCVTEHRIRSFSHMFCSICTEAARLGLDKEG
jgi:hypothetical protein